MFQFKTEKKAEYLQGKKIKNVAQEIGISRVYLSYILNGRKTCSKFIAYCIVKTLHSELEIADYFNRVK